MSTTNEASPPAVPGYETLHKIGEGGMGEVFLARPLGSDQSVAIKFLTTLHNDSSDRRLRFRRESRLVRELVHPNIVTVLDHGCIDDRDYFVMEFVDGPSLRAFLKPLQPMELNRARALLDAIAQALIYLSNQGIVHRDLKPENVLVDAAGRVKVTDFGISARTTDIGLVTATGQVLGTVDYMAPEQRARLPLDQRADQYSFAVIAYEMLTGRRPLGHFKPPSVLNPVLDPDIDAVLSRGLQEDPDDRYPTMEEFHAALSAALRPRRFRLRVLRPLIGVAAFLMLAALLFLAKERSRTSGEPVPIATPPAAGAAAAPTPQAPTANATYYLELGEEHLKAHRNRDAEVCFTEALRLEPKRTDVLLRRAFLYKKINLIQNALDDLNQAIALDPKLADALLGRGSVYVLLKDYPKALTDLNAALEVDPKSSLALAYRGYTYHHLGQRDEATHDLDQAVELDPANGVAYQFRALVYNARKQPSRALPDFRKAAEYLPDDPFPHNAVAQILSTSRDPRLRAPAEALPYAEKACALTDWKDWRQLRILAVAYAENGQLDKAESWFQKAIELAPPVSQKSLRDQVESYRRRARDPQENKK